MLLPLFVVPVLLLFGKGVMALLLPLLLLLLLLLLLPVCLPAEKDNAELPEWPELEESMDTVEFVVSLLRLDDSLFVFDDFVASA